MTIGREAAEETLASETATTSTLPSAARAHAHCPATDVVTAAAHATAEVATETLAETEHETEIAKETASGAGVIAMSAEVRHEAVGGTEAEIAEKGAEARKESETGTGQSEVGLLNFLLGA
jgi:hypothetical protein